MLFKQFNRIVPFNGEHLDVAIRIETCVELDKPDFDYGNELENAREMQRFSSGELENVLIHVSASALDETGFDSIGQCFIRTKFAVKDTDDLIANHEMVSNAIEALKANILDKANKLARYATKA